MNTAAKRKEDQIDTELPRETPSGSEKVDQAAEH